MTQKKLLWKPKSDPLSPSRPSKRIDTCTKTQGSSLQSPKDHKVAERMNQKDPQQRRPAGEAEARRKSRGEQHLGSTKTEGGLSNPQRVLLGPSPMSPAQRYLATPLEHSNHRPRPLATASLIRFPGLLCQKEDKGLVDWGQKVGGHHVHQPPASKQSARFLGSPIALSVWRRKLKGSPSPVYRAFPFLGARGRQQMLSSPWEDALGLGRRGAQPSPAPTPPAPTVLGK